MCPLPMSTWNVVLGRDSVTTPSSSIISSFAKRVSLLEGGQRPSKFSVGYRDSLLQFFYSRVTEVPLVQPRHMAGLFPFGSGHGAALPVGQQEKLALLSGDKEQLALVPSGRRPDDSAAAITHRPHLP